MNRADSGKGVKKMTVKSWASKRKVRSKTEKLFKRTGKIGGGGNATAARQIRKQFV